MTLRITADRGRPLKSQLVQSLAKFIYIRHHAIRHRMNLSNDSTEVLRLPFDAPQNARLRYYQYSPRPGLSFRSCLGLRSSIKEDLQASVAELVYGEVLRLPGDFFLSPGAM